MTSATPPRSRATERAPVRPRRPGPPPPPPSRSRRRGPRPPGRAAASARAPGLPASASRPAGTSVATTPASTGASAPTSALASLSASTARQAITGRPAATAGSASASAWAPAGLWAASRTSGGSPSTTSIRPCRSSPAATSRDPLGVERAEDRLRGGERDGEVAAQVGRSGRQLDHRREVADADQLGAALGADPPRDPLDLRGQGADHQGRLVAQHGELLGRDLDLGLAEVLRVLEADRGQHGHPRGDHVGRVEAAAEPGLDHRDLDPRRGEGDERGRRVGLELGHRLALVEGPVDDLDRLRDPLGRGAEGLLGELGAADADPLAPAAVVRRQVGAGADPVRLQQRRGDLGHRGLAVGADDVHGCEPVLGHPEHRDQAADPLEPEAHPERLQRAEVGLALFGRPGQGATSQLVELGA